MHASETIVLKELNAERHLINDAQFAEVMEEHERTGKSLSQIIVDFGLLSEAELLQAVANHLNLEFLHLDAMELEPSAMNTMPASVARMYGAVPVSMRGNSILVAVLDPYNLHLVEELSFVLGKDVQLAVALTKQIRDVIDSHFSEESGSLKQVIEDMESELANDRNLITDLDKDGVGTAAIEEMASQAHNSG